MEGKLLRRGGHRLFITFAATALVASLGVAGAGSAAGPPKPPPGKPDRVAGELIVAFQPGTDEERRGRALARAGANDRRALGKANVRLASTSPERLERALKILSADPSVRHAEPNATISLAAVPNDPSFNQLWALRNTGQNVNGTSGTAGADISAAAAWDVTTGSDGIVVAVIDTGVDFSHPDLGGSRTRSAVMAINPGENCGSPDPAVACAQRADGIDNDGNGYADDWRGWDFVNADNDAFDDNGHGTHVAGTIGAIGNNGTGIAGVNWRVKVMPLKFLDDWGYGTLANAIAAVSYATSMGAHVQNNSWGGGAYSHVLREAIEEADRRGSLVVAAAGNAGANNDASPAYPASYDVPNVVSVAATDQRDGRASFSNYGRVSVDLGAPGVNVYSTVPGGGYDWWDGTSMAAPHVSGAAALAKAAFPNATAAGLKALLLRSVDPKTSLADVTASGGRLNVNAAVRCSGAPRAWLERPAPGFTAAVGEPVELVAIGTACAAPGATLTASVNGSPVQLEARGDGLYTGTFRPAAAGTVEVSVTAAANGASDSRSVSGTAQQGYYVTDDLYAWIDTSGATNLGVRDETTVGVSLPFAFTYFEEQFTSVTVSDNGFFAFGPAPVQEFLFQNTRLPWSEKPNGVVAPYWDDLDPNNGGAVYARTVGQAPNRKFVLSWVGVPHYNDWWRNPITFQAILEEGTNDIVFQYRDTGHGDPTYDHGASATVGVENLAGSAGRQFSYNESRLEPYQSAKALRLTSRAVSDTTAPAAPAGLTATGGATSVALDWADGSEDDLAGYRVYRKDGTSWTLVGSTTESAYVDQGLQPGTTYVYRVTAVDGSGNESTPSGEASAATDPDTTPPAAPTGLTAGAGDARVALDWADNGEADIAGYRVYRESGGAWVRIADATASAYVDTGLQNGVTYRYSVTALDRSGNESPASATVSATPQAPPPPVTRTVAVSGFVVSMGSYAAGSLASLHSDDGNRLEIAAAKVRGNYYVADSYAHASITAAERQALRAIAVDWDGNASLTGVSVTIEIYNWRTRGWETLDAHSATTADRSVRWSTDSRLEDYVSATGELRVAVVGEHSKAFRTRTDLVRLTITTG